jgi:hypothetical protein
MDAMQDGFLGYKSSFMLDFVVVALVLIVPILLFSLYTVKVRKDFTLHRNLQLLLGIVLLVAVAAFEVDLRLQGGWQAVVNKGEPKLTSDKLATVAKLLYVHLVFAISTPFLWIATITLALRRFPNPPHPGPHSRLHKTLGWLSTIDITLTSVTGLVFYYVAFVVR